jgi:lysophospholipase L1-like esterase
MDFFELPSTRTRFLQAISQPEVSRALMHSTKIRILFNIFLGSLFLLLMGCGALATKPSTPGAGNYAALGDSLAAGYTSLEGYVPRYARHVQADTGIQVNANDLGQPGWTSSDLLNGLRTDAQLRNAVSAAEVVTWDIGGNDLKVAYQSYLANNCGGSDNQDCLRNAVATFKTNWDAIISEILLLRDPNKTILRTMDVYNPFVAEQQALGNFGTVKPYLDDVDAYIQSSSQLKGIPCAKVYLAFNGPAGTDDPILKGLIAIDGFHANDIGHDRIATLLRGLAYAPLK